MNDTGTIPAWYYLRLARLAKRRGDLSLVTRYVLFARLAHREAR